MSASHEHGSVSLMLAHCEMVFSTLQDVQSKKEMLWPALAVRMRYGMGHDAHIPKQLRHVMTCRMVFWWLCKA